MKIQKFSEIGDCPTKFCKCYSIARLFIVNIKHEVNKMKKETYFLKTWTKDKIFFS